MCVSTFWKDRGRQRGPGRYRRHEGEKDKGGFSLLDKQWNFFSCPHLRNEIWFVVSPANKILNHFFAQLTVWRVQICISNCQVDEINGAQSTVTAPAKREVCVAKISLHHATNSSMLLYPRVCVCVDDGKQQHRDTGFRFRIFDVYICWFVWTQRPEFYSI